MSENVEIELAFRRSSFCESSGCVEVASTNKDIYMHDSKLMADGPVLTFSRASWNSFLDGVRAGEFEAN